MRFQFNQKTFYSLKILTNLNNFTTYTAPLAALKLGMLSIIGGAVYGKLYKINIDFIFPSLY